MKKIILLSIFLLNLLTLVSNIDMGNQMLAQNMGSEVTLYPCKTFDPTTGNDEWHFSTSPCDNELGGTCVSVCRTCGMQGDCESMKYHSHGTGYSGGDNSYRDGNTLPSPGGGVVGGGGGSTSIGGGESSTGNNSSPLDNTLHIPALDELCIKYNGGYLPSSYCPQECSNSCFTTCMEYCYNFYNNCFDDKFGINRYIFESIFSKYCRGNDICCRGMTLCQSQFLIYCGFDIQEIDFSNPNAFLKINEAITNNHPIMVSLQVSHDYISDTTKGHELVVVGYRSISNEYVVIDPGLGNIHTLDTNNIIEAYIINGYSPQKH